MGERARGAGGGRRRGEGGIKWGGSGGGGEEGRWREMIWEEDNRRVRGGRGGREMRWGRVRKRREGREEGEGKSGKVVGKEITRGGWREKVGSGRKWRRGGPQASALRLPRRVGKNSIWKKTAFVMNATVVARTE